MMAHLVQKVLKEIKAWIKMNQMDFNSLTLVLKTKKKWDSLMFINKIYQTHREILHLIKRVAYQIQSQ